MLRLVLFLVGVAVAAAGLSWLADRPGNLLINWQGYEIETSVFRAIVILLFVIGLAIMLFSLLLALWRSPASLGAFFNRRRQVRGLEALSSGMIAIGAGDRNEATRHAIAARKALPNEPLTQLLRAQAAQLSGDRTTSRRMFEAMLASPETEQLGLRGLFLEAEREGEKEAARQFAERSVELNPRLAWAVDALFEHQCKDGDWSGALKTLGVARKHQHHDKSVIDRRRAVVLTARAMAIEESEPDRAMGLAIEAHHLAHDLVPAAALAGRLLAARGHTKRAAKIIERTWRRAPHPDLAIVHAHVRIGDSPSDRLERARRLGQLHQHSIESPIAIASAAIDARDWTTARNVLLRLDPSRMTQRVCTLMARIEGEEHGDTGKVREWLARAVHAPRDPAWVADGVVTDRWAPISPVTGTFDAFQWRVPADALDGADNELIARKLDELVRLGAPAAALDVDVPVMDVEPAPAQSQKPVTRPAPSRDAEDVSTVTSTRPASARVHPVEPTSAASGPAPRMAEVSVVPAADQPSTRDRKPLDAAMFIAPKATDDAGSGKAKDAVDHHAEQQRLAAGGSRRR
jgi:HemY protein